MQGFIIFEDYGEFVAQMSAWFQEGTIKFCEDILHGCPASSQTSVSVTAIEVRMSFSAAC